jgi:hypothetical protein
VDDSFLPGIGRRPDGWLNRDLNIGAIVATAPDLSAFAKMLQVDEATVRRRPAQSGRQSFPACHDGRFATLGDVVNHYDRHFGTRLTERKRKT